MVSFGTITEKSHLIVRSFTEMNKLKHNKIKIIMLQGNVNALIILL